MKTFSTSPIAALVIGFSALQGCATSPADIEPYREISCIARVQVSLKSAVDEAEKMGGRAIDAAYREVDEMGCLNGDFGYYDVTLLNAGKLTYLSVDARSGQLGKRRSQGFMREITGQFIERMFEGSSSSRIRDAARVTMRLPDAIAKAERAGGRAMEAQVAMRDGHPGYTVKIVREGKLQIDWIDG